MAGSRCPLVDTKIIFYFFYSLVQNHLLFDYLTPKFKFKGGDLNQDGIEE